MIPPQKLLVLLADLDDAIPALERLIRDLGLEPPHPIHATLLLLRANREQFRLLMQTAQPEPALQA